MSEKFGFLRLDRKEHVAVDKGVVVYLVLAVALIVAMIVLGERAFLLFAAVMAAVMILLGVKQYHEVDKVVMPRFSNHTLAIVAIIAAVIFAGLLFRGFDAVAVTFADGVELSLPVVIVLVAVFSATFGGVLYGIGRIAGLAKAGHLYTRQTYVAYTRMEYRAYYAPNPYRESEKKRRA